MSKPVVGKTTPPRLLSRLIRSMVQSNSNKDTINISAFKTWTSHLSSSWNTVEQLKMLQAKLMNQIEVEGTMTNEMVNDELNQWSFYNNNTSTVTIPTLLLHGYAASSMSFYRTFAPLSNNFKNLYAIDLPANGLSVAIPLKITKQRKRLYEVKYKENNKFSISYPVPIEEQKPLIEQYENYYLDAMRSWQVANNIEKFNLVGHSFGGYFSFKYALRFPDSINKLCLVSPLGMESNIFSIHNKFEENKIYNVNLTDPTSPFYGKKFQIPNYLFENQLDVIRKLGPFGARLCWNYILSAYKRVPSMEYKEYLFELFYGNRQVSPILCELFTNLLTRNLLARDPILDSIDQLQLSNVLVMYGEHDWMNRYAGYCMVSRLNNIRRTPNTAQYLQVPAAGHNLFLDNPEYFSSALASFFKE
ncbi:uncharacterized protein NDAI_0J01210 [Naumovozyma dairenensis CBS 421]|uniref:AB hydrolase-1 domain-containing protein n=1 Tax=Naumovozyma dairenensis (strain ATCC 10597 / BCRC 20456 / CBS 421 / NBRC 0211 / NRRL Y-12639) TaxID=1071378 RepID=G0WGT5_NAUDC|nr:hypothetical protein NDAI_0J01210 [Naumovozyma dairenensis CBS 421]CCD27013.1 hypothetical protein NDAI_0J01210 [Naumovozyma dairenensis CBS 421]